MKRIEGLGQACFKHWAVTLCSVALTGITTLPPAQAQTTPDHTDPKIENLGEERYRIGSIEVDKVQGSFQVPGKVLRDEPPIEFLVGTRAGYKNYETVLEVDADAFEFNLACILIGLDATNATTMEQRSQGAPLEGDRVEISVSWSTDGKTVTVPGARLLSFGDPPRPVESDDWVYTGSVLLPDGHYLAQSVGTLVGVVHKGESVIEHREGIAVGNYGSLLVNKNLVPAVGEAVTLKVTRVKAQEPGTR